MYFESDDYNVEDVLEEYGITYTEVDGDDILKDCETESLIKELEDRDCILDVLWELDFNIPKKEKRVVVQKILGHNHLATSEEMMNDFVKLFA